MIQFFKIRIGKTNTYLLQSEFSDYILIDTCTSCGSEQLIQRISRLGIKPYQIKLIVLTHSHYDHCGALADLKEWSNAPVLAHQDSLTWLKAGISYPVKAVNPLFDKVIQSLQIRFPDLSNYKPVNPDITVTDNYDLSSWGIPGRIIHTPGHTQDSISVILNSGTAFAGDAIFNIACWTISPPFQEDKCAVIDSWIKLNNENCLVYHPGHGLPVSKYRLIRAIKKASEEA